MIQQAKLRPPYDRLKLWSIGLLICLVPLLFAFIFPDVHLDADHEQIGFVIWAGAGCAVLIYSLFALDKKLH